jgi:hypothetical protein
MSPLIQRRKIEAEPFPTSDGCAWAGNRDANLLLVDDNGPASSAATPGEEHKPEAEIQTRTCAIG